MTMLKVAFLEKRLTTWWSLWIIFFIYTSSMAIIVQFILPQVFPKVFLAHGLFVPDSTLMHQIASQKALEIAEKGWEVWELRPQIQYPAGVASIFYYLWKPEPYSMIPFNALVHATAGCLIFFLLTSFMKNRLAAACGATLFILNPASFEWTAQIHKDGTFILGNLMVLSAWLILLKAARSKEWLGFIYAPALTFLAVLLIWAPRRYWNHVALVACILCFALILFYWIFNFKKSSIFLSKLPVVFVTGCLMILVQIPFLDSSFIPEVKKIKSQENIKRQKEAANSLVSLSLIEIEKEIIFMAKDAETAETKAADTIKVAAKTKSAAASMTADTETAETKAVDTTKATSTTMVTLRPISAKLKKIHNDLTRRQIAQDALYNKLRQFTSGSNLMNMKYKVKREVPEENNEQLSWVDLGERLQVLIKWEKELTKRQIVFEQKKKSILEWVKTPYLPDFIENKLYWVWCFRMGVVSTGGNTVIDCNVSLNSAGAFIRYFSRALQVGFLSPFPSEWFRTGSTPATNIGKKIMGGIMILFYICLAFFIRGLWEYRKSLEFWIITLNSTFGIIVFTYVNPNVGSLSRMRYGFYMVIIGMGFAFAVQKLIELRGNRQSRALPSL